MKEIQPADVPKPGSNYAQAVLLPAGGQRLILAGQIGVKPDGTVVQGIEGQMEQAWANVMAILREAGFTKEHIVRVVVYVTEPDRVGLYREVRDRVLAGHRCPNTFLEIAGLATPELKCEIEVEAQKPV